MKTRLFRLLRVFVYVALFLVCEYALDSALHATQFSSSTVTTMLVVKLISCAGLIIEVVELHFGIEIYGKLKKLFNGLWQKIEAWLNL